MAELAQISSTSSVTSQLSLLPKAPRHDVSTYTGRLRKFIDLTSPQHLFHDEVDIKRCQKILEGGDIISSNHEIMKCQSMVEACVHPTTHEIIPFYGRMASFVPVNIPVCAGLLFTSPTLPNLIGWQFINQTYNAVFNHCNAAKGGNKEDATKPASFMENYGDVMKGYAGAVVVSVGLSIGLTQWLKRAKLSPTIKSCLQAVVPYTAVASAAMANVGFMRFGELTTGLPVTTPEGVYVGHSKIAAKNALTETIISRAGDRVLQTGGLYQFYSICPFPDIWSVLSVPILLVPPPLIALALRWNVLRSSKFLKAMTELTFLTLGIAVGLPMAIALYPQTAKLSLAELEPELKAKAEELRNEIGGGDQFVLFNKGV